MSATVKTVNWTIQKGIQTVTLSSNTVTVSPGSTSTVSATWLGSGTLSATSSDPSVATVLVSGSTITVTGVAVGGVSITASVSESARYLSGSKNISVTVNNLATLPIPTQSGTLTYTGSTLVPTWNNYDSSKMTISGTASATNAGTYIAKFTLASGYQWSDGTTSVKSVGWVINKANPNVTVSPSSISVAAGSTTTLTVTRSGTGTITVSSNNASAATATVSGTTVTVTGVSIGNASITVSVAETANYNSGSAISAITISDEFICTIYNNSSNGRDIVVIYSDSRSGNGSVMQTVPLNGSATFSIPTYGMIVVLWYRAFYTEYLYAGTGNLQEAGSYNAPIVSGNYYQQFPDYVTRTYLIKKEGTFYWRY